MAAARLSVPTAMSGPRSWPRSPAGSATCKPPRTRRPRRSPQRRWTWPRDGVPPKPGALADADCLAEGGRPAAARPAHRRQRGLSPASRRLRRRARRRLEDRRWSDDRLGLIFACCHPALALEVRVALTLRYVAGLATREIAAAFLTPEPTLAQRLVRAKRKIRASGIRFERAGRRCARRAARGRAGGDLPGVQRGLRGDRRRANCCVSTCARRPSGWAGCCTACCPTMPRRAGLLALMLLNHSHAAARQTRPDGLCCSRTRTVALGPGDDRRGHRAARRGGRAPLPGPVPVPGSDRGACTRQARRRSTRPTGRRSPRSTASWPGARRPRSSRSTAPSRSGSRTGRRPGWPCWPRYWPRASWTATARCMPRTLTCSTGPAGRTAAAAAWARADRDHRQRAAPRPARPPRRKTGARRAPPGARAGPGEKVCRRPVDLVRPARRRRRGEFGQSAGAGRRRCRPRRWDMQFTDTPPRSPRRPTASGAGPLAADVGRLLHGRARRAGRRDRAAGDPRQPRRQRRHPGMDGQRLHADRSPPASSPRPRSATGSAGAACTSTGLLLFTRRLGGLRAGAERRRADRARARFRASAPRSSPRSA